MELPRTEERRCSPPRSASPPISLGNFYVVDPGKYHVIKFDASGIPKKIIGKQGFGNGQLYYPQGVAVGLHSNGDTLLYVADTGNSRVVVFDDEGHYVGKFGDVTPAGALLNPGGIAYLKNRSTPGGLVLVADTRNHRIMLFKENGAFQKESPLPYLSRGRHPAARRFGSSHPRWHVADRCLG